MKANRNSYGEYEIAAWDKYIETQQAEPSSRVLDGSRDHGYDQEWIGRGAVDGIPVKAVYLLDADNYNSDEDAGSWDWDAAASQGRLIVDDELTDEECEALEAGRDIKRT